MLFRGGSGQQYYLNQEKESLTLQFEIQRSFATWERVSQHDTDGIEKSLKLALGQQK